MAIKLLLLAIGEASISVVSFYQAVGDKKSPLSVTTKRPYHNCNNWTMKIKFQCCCSNQWSHFNKWQLEWICHLQMLCWMHFRVVPNPLQRHNHYCIQNVQIPWVYGKIMNRECNNQYKWSAEACFTLVRNAWAQGCSHYMHALQQRVTGREEICNIVILIAWPLGFTREY